MSRQPTEVSIVAVDTGGTFTDVVALVDGRLTILKLPSTPDDPARAVLAGIGRIMDPTPTPFDLVHGSTVATNTLLERTGARVALITNRRFEDVIEIGRQNRPQLYALVGHRPPPLVDRDDRHGVSGRLGPDGKEEEPLDDGELRTLAAGLAAQLAGTGDARPDGPTAPPESVAICLLHSYANGAHEERVAQALSSLGVPLSVSSRLLPEYREYERMATTVVNAYIAPRMDRYLGRLAEESGAGRVRVMGSAGGAIPVERARRESVHTVLSGPAGGVAGALHVAAAAGVENLITFDMGGTSTDVSLCPGGPLQTREFTIAGVPVAIPVIDIHTVGAGGGSIATVDAGGALRVGPRSAGADPGPICYGRGGQSLTVTDAHVWLGRLPADAFLGGDVALDRAAIEVPLTELAEALSRSPDEAAEGILEVADTAMEGALRVISVERGHDPADFTLVPFGGAAGLHAVELAERLGIRRLLVPADPGVLSAFGMLVSPVRKDLSRTVLLGPDAEERIAGVFDELEAEARAAMAAEGVEPGAVRVRRLADVRYAGQSFELTVPATDWPTGFHEAHAARYGFAPRHAHVELVTARVQAHGPATPAPAAGPTVDAATPRHSLKVRHRGEAVDARSVARGSLPVGALVEGPAVVHEYSATLWLPPGWSAEVAESRALRVEHSPR